MRRDRTIVWGTPIIIILVVLACIPKIPFTNVSLTVPFAAEGPGPVFDTLGEKDGAPVIDIEGADTDATSGELYMTTVAVRIDMTLAQALGRWITTDDTLLPISAVMPSNQSPEEMEEENRQNFVDSESQATSAAMKYLGIPTKVSVVEAIDGAPAQGVFEAEDVITAVDGEHVDHPSQVKELVQAHKPGDTVTLTVERDKKPHDVTVTLAAAEGDPKTPRLGILMTSVPATDVKVRYNLNDVGGPSAGMIFSLAVIDKLSPGELTGGKKVAGTGTISEDGQVGPIGGIEHKIAAAHAEGAEIFLAPADNCAEAARSDHGDMPIAKVSNIDDAVNAMKAYAAGTDFPTCG